MGLGFLNFVPQLPDFAGAGMNWGIASMARNRYASQVRHLRRREYQDMMFSMKQAGLNPILAGGAQPGHSAAMNMDFQQTSSTANVGSAVAANRQADASLSNAKVNKVKAPYEVGRMTTQNYLDAARIGAITLNNAYTAAQTKKTAAETNLALQESGTAAIKRLLMKRQAEKEGASAKELTERGMMHHGSAGAIAGRALTSARETDQQMGGWSGLAESLGQSLYDMMGRPSAPKDTKR